MSYKKKHQEITFFLVSFVCISALFILLSNMNNEKKELESTNEKLEESNSKLKDDIGEQDLEIDDMSKKVEDLSNSLDKQEKEVEKLKKDKKKLNDNNKKLNDNINKKDSKIEELQGLVQLSKKEKKNKAQPPKEAKKNSGRTMTMEVTAYTARCDGCSGITYKGTNVKDTIYHPSGHRVVAVDPNVIPLGTKIKINGEIFIADDIGGAIKGNRLDMLVRTKTEAYNFGRRNLTVEILN